MSNLENNILKELDRHYINGKTIGVIMEKLKTNNLKNEFLNYLIDNRNIVLDKKDIIFYLKNNLLNELH